MEQVDQFAGKMQQLAAKPDAPAPAVAADLTSQLDELQRKLALRADLLKGLGREAE
jgi:hypothetical protein